MFSSKIALLSACSIAFFSFAFQLKTHADVVRTNVSIAGAGVHQNFNYIRLVEPITGLACSGNVLTINHDAPGRAMYATALSAFLSKRKVF
jgi:hypothetical protein